MYDKTHYNKKKRYNDKFLNVGILKFIRKINMFISIKKNKPMRVCEYLNKAVTEITIIKL